MAASGGRCEDDFDIYGVRASLACPVACDTCPLGMCAIPPSTSLPHDCVVLAPAHDLEPIVVHVPRSQLLRSRLPPDCMCDRRCYDPNSKELSACLGGVSG